MDMGRFLLAAAGVVVGGVIVAVGLALSRDRRAVGLAVGIVGGLLMAGCVAVLVVAAITLLTGRSY